MQHQASLIVIAILGTVALFSFGKATPTLGVAIHALRLRGVGPGDVEEGPVAVTGSPEPLEDTVESPWTDEECLAFDAHVSRRTQRSRRGSNWRSVRTMGREVPFGLSGPTGRVAVDPDDADLHMKETYRAVTEDRRESPPDPENADGGVWGYPVIDTSRTGNHRYVEERIDPDDQVTVFGVAEYDSPGDRRPTITDGDGWFDPPFAVYANDSADPLRSIVVRTALFLGLAIASLAAVIWLGMQLFASV